MRMIIVLGQRPLQYMKYAFTIQVEVFPERVTNSSGVKLHFLIL